MKDLIAKIHKELDSNNEIIDKNDSYEGLTAVYDPTIRANEFLEELICLIKDKALSNERYEFYICKDSITDWFIEQYDKSRILDEDYRV